MIYTLPFNPAVDRELTVPQMEFDSVLRATDARVDYGGKAPPDSKARLRHFYMYERSTYGPGVEVICIR